ncbi:unnamed protein product [Symbiodinium sp. CCMP2592]|nr:unnamed protein product [Symbiodinium sp. CCMP2592]
MVFVMLMDLPAAVFLVSLIFGQHLTCERWCPSLWVDKLCVDQTSDTTKQRGIAGLPTVVACTGTLLVLWDATYFERLWCNLELSVFVKCCGVKRLRFVPLWLTPWLLGTMCITYLEARLQSLALIYDPSLGTDSIVESDTSELQTSAWGWQHVLTFLAETQVFTVSYLPVIIFSIVTFHQKLDGHKLMLEHLKTYDIREAKCSVESDRPLIEGLVAELFDGLEDPVIAVPLDAGDFVTEASLHRLGLAFAVFVNLEEADQQLPEAGLSSPARLAIRSVAGLGHQDCLQFFNDYVRGPVRDAIINDLGSERKAPELPEVTRSIFLGLSCPPFCSASPMVGLPSSPTKRLSALIGEL